MGKWHERGWVASLNGHRIVLSAVQPCCFIKVPWFLGSFFLHFGFLSSSVQTWRVLRPPPSLASSTAKTPTPETSLMRKPVSFQHRAAVGPVPLQLTVSVLELHYDSPSFVALLFFWLAQPRCSVETEESPPDPHLLVLSHHPNPHMQCVSVLSPLQHCW